MCIVWCITCGEDGDPIGSFLPVKKVIYSWKPPRNNKGSAFVTHNECLNICVASLLKMSSHLVKSPIIMWSRQIYFRAKLKELKREKKRDSHRNLRYASWPEKEASFHPVHSSRLLTTSNHRRHYQQPYPLITRRPSTKGGWSSHALTPTGIEGQWKCLIWNWVFRHARVISHQTSELQNELREDEGHIFTSVAHVLASQRPLLAKAELKRTGTY